MPVGLIVKSSSVHGKGVFATRDLKQGAIVLVLDDSRLVSDKSKLTPRQEKYEIDVFIDKDGNERVVLAGTPERYINHSCNPNVYVRTDMRSGIRTAYALREIRRGEELGWDYMINGWEMWKVALKCRCGSDSCRKVIGGNFFTLSPEVKRRYAKFLDGPFRRRFELELGMTPTPRSSDQ